MRDRLGNEVKIGDTVRVLAIPHEYLALLPDDERPRIEAMLNQELVVDGLPEDGKVSVSISWNDSEGQVSFGGLYMLPHEFVLVRRSDCSS